MSYVIIDGYNLIGIHHGDLSREREKVVNDLKNYSKIKGHDITIVFDGWKSGGSRHAISTTEGVRVIYSRLGEKADSVIKKIIAGGGKEWIVISSDRDIVSFAWSSGSVPVSSDVFMAAIENAGKSPAGDYEAIEEEPFEYKKGNPRMPSKKQKALSRVLNKL